MFQAVPTAGDIIEQELKLQASPLVLTPQAGETLLSRLSDIISGINQALSRTIH